MLVLGISLMSFRTRASRRNQSVQDDKGRDRIRETDDVRLSSSRSVSSLCGGSLDWEVIWS